MKSELKQEIIPIPKLTTILNHFIVETTNHLNK